jgi:hypothetical protein
MPVQQGQGGPLPARPVQVRAARAAASSDAEKIAGRIVAYGTAAEEANWSMLQWARWLIPSESAEALSTDTWATCSIEGIARLPGTEPFHPDLGMAAGMPRSACRLDDVAKPLVDDAIDLDPYLPPRGFHAVLARRAAAVSPDPHLHCRDHPPPPGADRLALPQAHPFLAGPAGPGLPAQRRDVAELAAGFGVGRHRVAICQRDVALLAARSPKLRPAGRRCSTLLLLLLYCLFDLFEFRF